MFGTSNNVAGMTVQGDLGWRKLEERREKMTVRDWWCWKREDWLEQVENKLREDGGFGWREECEVFRRKCELGSENGSV